MSGSDSTDRYAFLHEKADNFRQYILGQRPDAELTAQIDGFRKETLLPTLTTVLLPMIRTRGIPALADELMTHLTPTDPAAVRAKLQRYLECFNAVLTAA